MSRLILLPEAQLFALNAFDVGNNPQHVDYGLMKHRFVEKVQDSLQDLSQTSSVVLSGLSIELLDEEAPELIEELTQAIESQNINVIGALYYHTSLSLLDADTFQSQWRATQESFSKVGLETHQLYIGNQQVPKELSPSIASLHLQLLSDHELDQTIGAYSALHSAIKQSELSTHITSELQAMEPHLKGDEDLHTTWQLLGNTQIQEGLQGEQPQHTYESYFTLMHILNDMAHTVRNVELTKRGEFENEAQIVDSPSQRILEVIAR